jgi:hypothetical protein
VPDRADDLEPVVERRSVQSVAPPEAGAVQRASNFSNGKGRTKVTRPA